MNKIYLGAAYYPELWAEEELDKDIVRMKATGVNCMRIGEFAWSKIEAKEGEINLSFFEKVVDKLYENGISTVVCTPTCTPPRWLFEKYPETMQVKYNGEKGEVFARCHPCKSSLVMREKNRIIVRALAKSFGKRKGVIGWQIDNELYPYDEGCFCQTCQDNFKKYLKEKYKTIENLNDSWVTYRWSLNYDSFEDVLPPRCERWEHPSLQIEWFRFQSNNIASYLNEQAETIREFSTLPIGTNMMPGIEVGHYKLNENLDVMQFDHYEPANRLPHTAFSYDFLRAVKDKPFWVVETQAGWNGANTAAFGYRPQGNCYANTWLPIARGAEMNMYWHFRAHTGGHELAHGAMFNSAGRAYHICDEIKKASEEFEKCQSFLVNSKVQSKIALHYSTVASTNFRYAPIMEKFYYRETILEDFYASLKHYNVDVIDLPHSLEGYETLISPFIATIDDEAKERILTWVQKGGTWIVGPQSDIMSDCGVKYSDNPFSFLEDTIGVYTKYQLPIANNVFKAKWSDGEELGISKYYDAFECKNCQSLAIYDGFDFDGYTVVAQKEYGKGKIILLGSVLSKEGLRKLVDSKPILEASDNINLTERMGEERGIIVVETEAKDGYIYLERSYTDKISGRTLSGKVNVKPYEVLVLI